MRLRVYCNVAMEIWICITWILYCGIENKGALPMTADKDIDLRLSKDHEKYRVLIVTGDLQHLLR